MAALLAGCSSETVESEGIATSAIWAGITMTTTNNTQAGITVELNAGGENGTNLVLNNNDRVQVTSSRETITLTEDSDFLDVDYEGSIDIGGGGDTLTVALLRNGGSSDASAPNSNVVIPESFVINYPQDNMTLRGLNNLEILWTPVTQSPARDMDITLEAECENEQRLISISTEDDGRYISDFFTTLSDVVTASGCDVNLTLTRTVGGQLDPAFSGGVIEAKQIRETDGIRLVLE